MGLIEICLFALVAPQGPAAVGATETAASPQAQLAQLEQAGEYADADALVSLTLNAEPAVAARSAWLLANSRNPSHTAALPRVAAESPHAEARLHSLNGLLQRLDPDSTSTAVDALDDPDRAVRTVAANLLGGLGEPAAAEPLLRVLHADTARAGATDATDVKAALVALADLGEPQHLLRMATALDHDAAPECGEALAYAFQELSPRLDARRETTALIAVLGHRAQLLRRYAITRLTELRAPRSVAALEARLTREGAQLLPLIEVAIAQLRGSAVATVGEHGTVAPGEGAAGTVSAVKAKAMAWWRALRTTDVIALSLITTALFAGLWMIRRALRNRALLAEGEAAAALASHSDEYFAEHELDAGELDSCEEATGDDALEHDALEDQARAPSLWEQTPEQETSDHVRAY